jgi:hypothetical protein
VQKVKLKSLDWKRGDLMILLREIHWFQVIFKMVVKLSHWSCCLYEGEWC